MIEADHYVGDLPDPTSQVSNPVITICDQQKVPVIVGVRAIICKNFNMLFISIFLFSIILQIPVIILQSSVGVIVKIKECEGEFFLFTNDTNCKEIPTKENINHYCSIPLLFVIILWMCWLSNQKISKAVVSSLIVFIGLTPVLLLVKEDDDNIRFIKIKEGVVSSINISALVTILCTYLMITCYVIYRACNKQGLLSKHIWILLRGCLLINFVMMVIIITILLNELIKVEDDIYQLFNPAKNNKEFSIYSITNVISLVLYMPLYKIINLTIDVFSGSIGINSKQIRIDVNKILICFQIFLRGYVTDLSEFMAYVNKLFMNEVGFEMIIKLD